MQAGPVSGQHSHLSVAILRRRRSGHGLRVFAVLYDRDRAAGAQGDSAHRHADRRSMRINLKCAFDTTTSCTALYQALQTRDSQPRA